MEYPSIRVQVGPDNYFCYPGAIEEITHFLSEEEIDNALWLYGERAGKAAEPYLPKAFHHAKHKQLIQGHCTHEKVDSLVKEGRAVSVIIGIGGGSVQDIAKALSAQVKKPFVSVPTIAATCAAWTPLSVWYSLSGHALGYEIWSNAAFLLVVEPRIILSAPKEYLQAGVADTIAKWPEADIISGHSTLLPFTATVGLSVAKNIGEILLKEGEAAFRAMDEKTLSPTFIQVVDAVIAGGGMVGGLGEKFTRVAAAHAIHNGLSVLPETENTLHGLKVAYGTLVQTALLHDEEELIRLYTQFKIMGLPTQLQDLGVDAHDTEKIQAMVDATLAPHETIHLLPFTVDATLLHQAIERVEALHTNTTEGA